jgi:hypothetical protein
LKNEEEGREIYMRGKTGACKDEEKKRTKEEE